MRDAIIQHASSVRPRKPLVIRGGLARTFGGLVGFVVVTFLGGGFYILQDALANPLTEGAAAVIGAAFMITLAAILLFFLIKPRKRPRTTRRGRLVGTAAQAVQPFFEQAPKPVRQDHLRNNLVYQRFYVDRSYIRP
jgi:uncharacterized BrkB/YihY/UPF0761 family membrane protein